MSVNDKILILHSELPKNVTLVAVSKTHPAEMISEAYNAGQRIFGENRHAEMTAKYNELPKDIEWHFIGSIQRKNIKYIAPYVAMIHSADSAELIEAIDKEAAKCGRVIDILLEVYVAQEQTKHGFLPDEVIKYVKSDSWENLKNVRMRGVMGMATYTENIDQIRAEFQRLREVFETLKTEILDDSFDTLSMGMTGDYQIAIECGSNMVRIGSYIFGERVYNV